MTARRRGQSLVEIAIATALMVTGVAAAAAVSTATLKVSEQTVRHSTAIGLAEEGIEATISIRDRGFSELADGSHGIVVSSAPLTWTFAGTADVTESIFTRVVAVSTVDADTKLVTVTVTWQPEPNRTASVELNILLTRWPFI